MRTHHRLIAAVSLAFSAAALALPAARAQIAMNAPALDAPARQKWSVVITRGLADACRATPKPEDFLGALKAQGWPQLVIVPEKQTDELFFASPKAVPGDAPAPDFSATLDHLDGSVNVTCTGYFWGDDASEMNQAMIARFGRPNETAPGKLHWMHLSPDGGSVEAVVTASKLGTRTMIMASARYRGPRS